MSDPLANVLNAMENEQASVLRMETDQKRAVKEAEARFALNRLNRLFDDEDVQWFLKTYFAPVVESEDKACKDPEKAAKQGAVHAHRHQVAARMLNMLESERRVAESTVAQFLNSRR